MAKIDESRKPDPHEGLGFFAKCQPLDYIRPFLLFRIPRFYRIDFHFRRTYNRTYVLVDQILGSRGVLSTLPTEYPVRTDSANLAGVVGPSPGVGERIEAQ